MDSLRRDPSAANASSLADCRAVPGAYKRMPHHVMQPWLTLSVTDDLQVLSPSIEIWTLRLEGVRVLYM
jgi:hypothetical protein